MNKFIVIAQENINEINAINNLQVDDMYTVLNEYNGYSTICQYSKKYDSFHIATVKTDRLNDKLRFNAN